VEETEEERENTEREGTEELKGTEGGRGSLFEMR
jgi:hypothetical protein